MSTGRTRLGLWALGALGTAFLFASAMATFADYDEDQHLAAGLLTLGLLPYRDFVYLQPPLYPFVLAGVFKLSGGHYMLAARLLTFVLSWVSGALLWRMLRRFGAGPWFAVLLMTACLGSPMLYLPLSIARNDALPLVLMLAGLSVQLGVAERSWWGRAGAALLLGLAAEAKLTYLFGPMALGLHALAVPRRLPPVLLGTGLAAIPAVLCYAAAPDGFLFGLLGYHLVAPLDWYTREGLGETLLVPSRLGELGVWLVAGGNLALVMLCTGLALVATARRRGWDAPGPLLTGMVVLAAGLGFMPAPSWPMYYAAVVPLLALCAAHLDRVTRPLASARRRGMLAWVAVIPAVAGLVPVSPKLVRAASPTDWAGVRAHDVAAEVRLALQGGTGAVATLFPAAVMDANPILPGLASGPFVFRSAARFDPAVLARLHALSPAALAAAFEAAPPAAIYARPDGIGWTVAMDEALTGYAQQHGWPLVHTDAMGGRLWLRP